MENLILLLAITIASMPAASKSFRKYFIADTGCSINMFKKPAAFKFSQTPSGDKMYHGSCQDGNVIFGFISIHSTNISNDMEAAENLLGNFMTSLHPTFNIRHTIGISNSYTMKDNEHVKGLTDYWQDNENIDWKVKGWTNGNVLALLYVKNINEVETLKLEAFLDSFRFSTK